MDTSRHPAWDKNRQTARFGAVVTCPKGPLPEPKASLPEIRKLLHYHRDRWHSQDTAFVLDCGRQIAQKAVGGNMSARQKGFSLIELLIVVAIILIIAAIAIPNLLRSRMAANEASAVASLRTVNTSEIVYQSTYGGGFAPSLTDLSDGGTPASCAPGTPPLPTSACLIDSGLASGTKGGYVFAYLPVAVGGQDTSYTLNGDPVATTGQRHFFTDQTNVIRVNGATSASASDPAI